MTDRQIQELIDRYLDGATTPEEELELARELQNPSLDGREVLPPDWQAVSMMLGELALGEAEYDRIVESRQHKARTVSLRWRWAAAALAVAASLALLFIFSRRGAEEAAPQQQLIAEVTHEMVTPPVPSNQEDVPLQDISSPEEDITPQKLPSRSRRSGGGASLSQQEKLPENIGDDIWQNEENVLLALQMLSECEAAIQREEQEIRNDIVRATFNATPQPANAILVTNELGDYEVIETRTLIEI